MSSLEISRVTLFSTVFLKKKKTRKEIKQWITAFIAQELTVVYKPQQD